MKQLHFEFENEYHKLELVKSKINETYPKDLIKGIVELYLKFILLEKEEGRKNERDYK